MKKRELRQLLLTVLLTTVGFSANGDQISGRELLAFCQSESATEQKGYCRGYISAAIETHAAWALWDRLEPVFCFPEGDKFEHAYGAVIAYLQANKIQQDYEASSLVLNSLNQAFPCE